MTADYTEVFFCPDQTNESVVVLNLFLFVHMCCDDVCRLLVVSFAVEIEFSYRLPDIVIQLTLQSAFSLYILDISLCAVLHCLPHTGLESWSCLNVAVWQQVSARFPGFYIMIWIWQSLPL